MIYRVKRQTVFWQYTRRYILTLIAAVLITDLPLQRYLPTVFESQILILHLSARDT